MTEEEKKAALEAEQAEAKAKAEEKAKDEESAEESESDEEESEEEDESTPSDNIDYAAELERERKAREAAEKAAADNAFKLREVKRKKEEENDDDTEDDKPLTAKQFQELLAKERQANQRIIQEARITDIVKKFSDNEDERQLIVEIHKNRTFPDHLSLEEQLEEAYVIANRKKIMGERSELMRALKSKSGVNNNAAGTHHDAPKSEPKIPADIKASLTKVGYVYNNVTKQMEKKLKTGKTLVFNLQTRQTSVK